MKLSHLPTRQPIEWLLILLLLIAPFYFHPNIGGTGLRIPDNIVIWFVASVIGFYSLYKLTNKQAIYLPRYFILILAFPILAFLSGVISGVEIASQWTFRILYIWGGVLFFFSLFQYKLKQGRVDHLLFIVVISGLFHALVGISQIIWLKNLPPWLPINANGVPTGLFQQINNQASFQVTGIIIALWLASRPFITKGPRWRFILLLIALACATFVVSYSGSRVGALGFLLALPLVLISRWRLVKKDHKSWSLIAVVLLISISSASAIETNRGLTSALDKATAMNAGFSGSARLGMYKIAWDVIKEKPLFGHGIGSFIRVWQLGKPAFYAQHPDATLPEQRVAHPHNEFIFWLVEGGIIVGIGLVCTVLAILLTLKKLPPSRRYAYVAMLIPIVLHTQVELPFYISSLHWFVFLILLFVLMQPNSRRYNLVLTNAARNLLKIVAISGGLIASVFLSQTMAANLEFKCYIMKQTPANEEPFPIAMKNAYFKRLAAETMMTSLLYSSMREGLDKNVELFAHWGEQELSYNPHILYYTLTVQAYLYLKQDTRACTIAKTGQAIYPKDDKLNTVVKACKKADLI